MTKRVLTTIVGVTPFVAAIFWLPSSWFFWLCAAGVELAVYEFVQIARRLTPTAPVHLVLVLVPLGAGAVYFLLPRATDPPWGPEAVLIAGLSLVLLAGIAVLLGRSSMTEALPAMGILAFAPPYFILPIVSVVRLQGLDPWLLILLVTMVWLGDSAAYGVGRTLGRHKMSPVVSPNKTWEGAVAGFLAGMVVVVAWSLWRLPRVEVSFLIVSALALTAAQLGDLVESMMKRGAGVKDSGRLLPGHGGVLDRLDALFFSAPVFYFGLQVMR